MKKKHLLLLRGLITPVFSYLYLSGNLVNKFKLGLFLTNYYLTNYLPNLISGVPYQKKKLWSQTTYLIKNTGLFQPNSNADFG